MKFLATATTLILLQSASLIQAANQTETVPPANNSSNANSSTTPEPKIISLNCTQAFMPLQDDNTTTSANNNAAINITEAGCKAYETPQGAYCQAESCSGLPTCTQCNLLIPGATPKDTTMSNVTTPSVQCANNYFMHDLNDKKNNQSLCTDAKSQSYSCTGTCTGYASCGVCISMDDPALQDPTQSGGSEGAGGGPGNGGGSGNGGNGGAPGNGGNGGAPGNGGGAGNGNKTSPAIAEPPAVPPPPPTSK